MANKELKPTVLWDNFRSICAIPHPSKHEAKILAWLLQWAKDNNVNARQDKIGNLILSKPATKGMENRKGVILQGHIDMVPQKNDSKVHDFTKDPIEMIIGEDGWVHANETTLGADNGIGCAAAMAVMTATDIEHGDLEVLITVDEETGMTGASHLSPTELKGEILINLDSEDEGELYVGCAGGLDATATFTFKEEAVPANVIAYELKIMGFAGGHSGMDINCGKGNANITLVRFLEKVIRKHPVSLASINGGSLRNAIPREACALICFPEDKRIEIQEEIEKLYKVIMNEVRTVEPNFSVEFRSMETPKKIIDAKTTSKILDAIYACPNGVSRMSDSMSDLVETSTNLAIVKTEGNQVKISSLLRSSVDSAKYDLSDRMETVFRLAGAEYETAGGYPGWKPNMDSPILKAMSGVYKDLYGVTPQVKAIHAGLECGLLGGIYPNMDMISFGPTIRNPHSPIERVNIESVEKFWNFLVATLKNIPVK